jgi:3-oxoadipate enol-lactonase
MTLARRAADPTAAARWADLDGVILKYAERAGEGRPLLLLHEMGGTQESWEPALPHLAPGRPIVRFDMRGAGGSEKIRAALTMDRFASDAAALLRYLRIAEPVDVAGVAIGGCIGLRLAARHPDAVHRLAAINPPTDAGRSGEVLRERAALVDAYGMRGAVESALARSYPEHLRADIDAYEQYVARFLCNDPISYAHILRALAEVDFTGVLEAIRCPTTFVSGRHDLVREPAAVAKVSRQVRGAAFVEIDGGHIPSVQAPAAVAQALNAFFRADL